MLKRFYDDITKYFHYTIVSAKAQLKTDVAGSYLNWVWWILEPLCFMLIYSFVFGYVFNSREEHFSLYIFIGLTMWNFFSKTCQGSVRLIRNNKGVVSKVYFPKYVLVLTKLWVNGFKMLISFGIVAAMMLINGISVSFHLLFMIPILMALVFFTFGCSCFLMHWGVYLTDLSNIVSIGLKMMFYVTGVFYHLEKRVPQIGAALNRYNPMAYLLTAARQSLIYRQSPEAKWLVIWLCVSFLLMLLGIRKVYKEENSYVKAI